MDVFEIADILVEDVKTRFADSVAIVAYYGSYATGTATPRSDLDFFFIPDGPGASAASLQFIMDGIGFDFWPISWKRAERIASFDEPIVSVIADCRVLYARSPEDLDRLRGLQQKIRSMSLPENRNLMLRKAKTVLDGSYSHLYRVNRAAERQDLSESRRHAAEVAFTVTQSLVLANQTYFRKGMGQNAAEIAALRLKPETLDASLATISSSSECAKIVDACETTVGQTAALLHSEEARLRRPSSFTEAFQGLHEELVSTYNKIRTACQRGDRETAFYASLNVQGELESALDSVDGKGAYRELGLPDLADLFDADDLGALARAVTELETRFESILSSRNITLKKFESPESLRKHLASRAEAI